MIEHLNRAVDLDPNFAQAHSALALVHRIAAYYDRRPGEAMTAGKAVPGKVAANVAAGKPAAGKALAGKAAAGKTASAEVAAAAETTMAPSAKSATTEMASPSAKPAATEMASASAASERGGLNRGRAKGAHRQDDSNLAQHVLLSFTIAEYPSRPDIDRLPSCAHRTRPRLGAIAPSVRKLPAMRERENAVS